MGYAIRERLEASFETENRAGDQETRELLDAISSFAADISSWYDAFYRDAFAFEVFNTAVRMLLTQYRPKGDQSPKPDPTSLGDVIWADSSSEEVGTTLVRMWLSEREKRRFADKQ